MPVPMPIQGTEQSPVALLTTLKTAQELLDSCKSFLIPDHVERLPEEKLGEVAGYTTLIREACEKLCRAMNLQTAKNRRAATAARKKETPQGCTEPAAAEPERWVNDSWIEECEVAQVYSREKPVFGYSEPRVISVSLTRAEVWVLAQRHLNTFLMYREYFQWCGDCEEIRDAQASMHEWRFWELYEQLPTEDQQRFHKQIEIRQRYIKSVEAEVRRCGNEEDEFYRRVEAGMVSEAEVAAHRTPGFILGLPVMPSPADGGPGPEEWDMFESRENPLMHPGGPSVNGEAAS